ncbi:DUF805 domain-containing protein [Paracraurococcus ruber]|uniref:DUF805 domain-containing protein n=1 Tax=Paracraurococcus ruber TaxID=77675 RepID=A0ABS1CZ61_9PROT|nr:DUF805 domain-containing protein [Paracraurococcus ruber]MBK1659496.1 hypothetical protein [Paracraurococcus ruber]TDG27189.1 DUF805 domain-containing protein [Paracraurococcus ruber]
MGFQQAVGTCLARYAVFQGRARRSEYWWFFLFTILMQLATGVLDAALFGRDGMGTINLLTTLGLLLPGLAVGVRRLHDTDRSGWWLLVGLVPVIGTIALIIWFSTPGLQGSNRYGPDPTRAERFALA